MALMNNIGILLEDLRRNKWHITAFQFDYKGKNYIVLFEDITNLQLIANRYRETAPLSDKEICLQFAKSYGDKKL